MLHLLLTERAISSRDSPLPSCFSETALLQARGSLLGCLPLSTPNRTYGDQCPTRTVWEKYFSFSQSSLLLPSHSLVTHYFHSVARHCRDVPGALFPAGILVRPVWTAHHSLCTTQLVLTTSLRERSQDEVIETDLTWEPYNILHVPLCPPSAGQKQGRLQSLNKTF